MKTYTEETFEAAIQDARSINNSIEGAFDGKDLGTILMTLLMHIGTILAMHHDKEARIVLHALVTYYLDSMLSGIDKLGPDAQQHPVSAATACLHVSLGKLLVEEKLH